MANDQEPKNNKILLFGWLSLPGWLSTLWGIIWKVIGWSGNVEFVHDHWQWLGRFAAMVSTSAISDCLSVVGITWLLIIFFWGDKLRARIKPWKLISFAVISMIAISVAASMVVGMFFRPLVPVAKNVQIAVTPPSIFNVPVKPNRTSTHRKHGSVSVIPESKISPVDARPNTGTRVLISGGIMEGTGIQASSPVSNCPQRNVTDENNVYSNGAMPDLSACQSVVRNDHIDLPPGEVKITVSGSDSHADGNTLIGSFNSAEVKVEKDHSTASNNYVGPPGSSSPNTSVGANEAEILRAQTVNQYECKTPCGNGIGPYPDVIPQTCNVYLDSGEQSMEIQEAEKLKTHVAAKVWDWSNHHGGSCPDNEWLKASVQAERPGLRASMNDPGSKFQRDSAGATVNHNVTVFFGVRGSEVQTH